MITYDWLIKQYPIENRSQPLTIVDGGDNELPSLAHLKVVSVRRFILFYFNFFGTIQFVSIF